MKKDPSFVDIMKQEDADIVCLQETKAFHHQMPPELRLLKQNNICRHAGERP
jgi:exonuclease III